MRRTTKDPTVFCAGMAEQRVDWVQSPWTVASWRPKTRTMEGEAQHFRPQSGLAQLMRMLLVMMTMMSSRGLLQPQRQRQQLQHLRLPVALDLGRRE